MKAFLCTVLLVAPFALYAQTFVSNRKLTADRHFIKQRNTFVLKFTENGINTLRVNGKTFYVVSVGTGTGDRDPITHAPLYATQFRFFIDTAKPATFDNLEPEQLMEVYFYDKKKTKINSVWLRDERKVELYYNAPH